MSKIMVLAWYMYKNVVSFDSSKTLNAGSLFGHFHKPDLEDAVTGHDTEVNLQLSVSLDTRGPSV